MIVACDKQLCFVEYDNLAFAGKPYLKGCIRQIFITNTAKSDYACQFQKWPDWIAETDLFKHSVEVGLITIVEPPAEKIAISASALKLAIETALKLPPAQ